jgi:2-phosphosulfolactate phosphatase
MRNSVVIDCFPEAAARYRNGYAVVVVDVARTTTTAITIAASGCRCLPVPTLSAAYELGGRLGAATMAGEQRGIMPPGFDINNSPTEFLAHAPLDRPVVLLSSTGTRLCYEAAGADAVFLACLRNYESVTMHLAGNFSQARLSQAGFSKVAVIGAGSRGEFREEDQLCCAWVAEGLLQAGYAAQDRETLDMVRRWSDKPVDAWLWNKSAHYLRSSGQFADLEFILEHVADLSDPFMLFNDEVVAGTNGAALSA